MRKLVSVLHLYGWRLTVLALTWREWKKWLEPSEDRLKNVEQDRTFVFFWRSLYIRGSLYLSACEKNLNLVTTQKSWMSLERESDSFRIMVYFSCGHCHRICAEIHHLQTTLFSDIGIFYLLLSKWAIPTLHCTWQSKLHLVSGDTINSICHCLQQRKVK